MQNSDVIQLRKGNCVDQGKFVQLLEIRKVDFGQNDLIWTKWPKSIDTNLVWGEKEKWIST